MSLEIPKGTRSNDRKMTIKYLIFNKLLWVSILNVFFSVGTAAQASWIVPIGHIQPQKNLFVNNIIKIKIPKSRNGNIPSVIKKKIYSRIPAPVELGFLGEFNTGRTLTNPSKLSKFIEKITSIMI